MTYPVGTSSYDDGSSTSPHGQMQYVATQAAADQVNSLCFEFDTSVAQNGDRLSVNEGIRSRDRQLELYRAWKNGTGALAANPYTSTHDASRGSALDFGITSKDGGNRAPRADEWVWIHARAAARGIQHTGQYFNPEENWHHNAGYTAAVAPIPGVRLANSPLPKPDPIIVPQEDIMQLGSVSDTGKSHNGTIFAFTGNAVHATTNITEVYNLGRVTGILDAATDTEAEIRSKIGALGLTVSQAQLQSYVQYVQKIGGYIDPTYTDLKAK